MADISHQLKTPITSMMIMADLLEEAEPEKQTEFIHNISKLTEVLYFLQPSITNILRR